MTRMQTIVLESGIHRVWQVQHDSLLIVHDGSVWLTLERDPVDYWLAPGDRFLLFAGVVMRIGGWRDAVRCELVPCAPARRSAAFDAASGFERGG